MKHPMQPIYRDDEGVYRFKPNKIVRALLDTSSLDLNQLATMNFSKEDHEQLAQLIGYSVSGFGGLSYASKDTVEHADYTVEHIREVLEEIS